MVRTNFNQTIAKTLVVMGLVCVVGIGTVPAIGQMVAPGQFTSTPAQQAIYTFATSLSPYEQQLVVNALRKLGPQRASAEIAHLVQMNLATPGALSLLGPRVITPGLQSIPAQYHQSFVDGVLMVTSGEEQFAAQVLSRLVQGQQMQTGYGLQQFKGFAQSMGPGSFGSEGDPITQRDVWKWGHDLNKEWLHTYTRGQNMNPGMEMP